MAVDVPTPSDLPPTESAQVWLRQDPAVQEASANMVGAGHVAGMLRASPHEWTVKATSQQRRYEASPTSREWTAQLERTIRLPGKKAMDRQLGDVEVDLAKARLGEAIHEAALSLLDLWMAWVQAEHTKTLIAEQTTFAQSNLQAAQTRQRAGDASRLEVNVAAGDLAETQRRFAEVSAEATKARARLRIRFPDVPAALPTLSEPQPVNMPEQAWRELVMASSDPLRSAELEVRKAQRQAERTRADRLPDPTVGIFTASEAFRRERIIGVSVSFPLPGGYRRERLGQALTAVDAATAARDREQRVVETEIAEAYADADGNHRRWQLATKGASHAADTARLTQRAYTLGEADVQTLLLARRQSLEASEAALDARVTALRAYYRLLIDAHRIWGLAHE
ncbi:MAG: TolC family protein [Rhodanobacter sp.]